MNSNKETSVEPLLKGEVWRGGRQYVLSPPLLISPTRGDICLPSFQEGMREVGGLGRGGGI